VVAELLHDPVLEDLLQDLPAPVRVFALARTHGRQVALRKRCDRDEAPYGVLTSQVTMYVDRRTRGYARPPAQIIPALKDGRNEFSMNAQRRSREPSATAKALMEARP